MGLILDRYQFYFLIGVLLIGLSSCSSDDKVQLQSFKLKNGHEVAILADTQSEKGQMIYYQITKNDRQIIPTSGIGARKLGSEHRFIVYELENVDMVAVSIASNPKVLFVIHDFELNKSWPFHSESEDYKSVGKRGQILRDKFVKQYKKNGLKLASEVPNPFFEYSKSMTNETP